MADEAKQAPISGQNPNPKKKGSKQEVYDGIALCTPGGLKKEDLILNAKNKIVSKKRSEQGKKQIEHLKGKKNTEAVTKEPEKPAEPQPSKQPMSFDPQSASSSNNSNSNDLENKLNESAREESKSEYPANLPERYKELLKKEKSGEKPKEKEVKPKKPRKVYRKQENPIIDEILYSDKFENEEKL